MELKVLELLETVTFAAIEELQWLFFNVLIAYFILCQHSNDDSLKKWEDCLQNGFQFEG